MYNGADLISLTAKTLWRVLNMAANSRGPGGPT
jgi:hypothetical protein